MSPIVKLDLKLNNPGMNAEQIKCEIRKLSRTDKVEIYRWIDEEAAADLLSRIGIAQSPEMCQEIEWECRESTPEDMQNISPSLPNTTDSIE